MMPPFSYRDVVTLKDLASMRRFIEQAARHLGLNDDAITELVMAVNEAVTNVIIHGYEEQAGLIEIEVSREADQLFVCLRDQATPFNPTKNPVPDIAAPLENRGAGGMGIHMMRHFTDSIAYQVTDEGQNELICMKEI